MLRGEEMAGYMILGFLAAFGGLSLLWTMLGWLLPSGKGLVLVCAGLPDPGVLGRYRWLRGMGFLNCPLVCIVERSPGKVPVDMEFCSRESLWNRLEWEKHYTYGTGTGDSSGRDQRCDISEL